MKVKEQNVPVLRFPGFDGEWAEERLENFAKVIDCKHRTPPYVETGIPVISPGTINWGELDYDSPTKRVTEEEYQALMDHCTPVYGDMVFSRNQSIGVASILLKNRKFVLGQDTVLIQTKIGEPFFVYYGLQTYSTQTLIQKLSGGSTFSRINLKDIRGLRIMVAPIEQEQQKIASFLTAVDSKIEQLSKKKALLGQYKKGMMQKLFSQELRFKDEQGNDFPDWKEKALGEMCNFIKDGTHGTHKDDNSSELLLLSAKNIKNGRIIIHDADRRISKKEFDSILKNYKLRSKDILLSIVGTIGNVALFDGNEKIAFQRSVAFFRLLSDMPEFIFQQMVGEKFQRELNRRKVISAQPGIYLGDLKKILMITPCQKEQQKIANFLSSIDKKITLISTELNHAQSFKKSLLQQMFV